MTPDAGTDGPVLFAYDGSDRAKAAIQQAAVELRPGRRAVVLSVWEPLEAVPFWGAPMSLVPEALADQVEKEAQKTAEEGAELARKAGFEAEAAAAEGAPVWQQIVDAAEQRDADIIVIGSHGRSGAAYLALGSVATAVAHHSKVPVLICRASG